MSYNERVRFLKNLQLVLIIVCVTALVGYLFFLTRPTINAYAVRDECGEIGGSISHSIDDEDACRNACAAYCLSLEQEFHDSDFSSSTIGCHDCDCKCKTFK